MKKILIVVTNFRHGGISKSLQNILALIDKERYFIDVYALEHYGQYEAILKNCKILKPNIWVESLIANWRDTKGVAKVRSGMMKIANKISRVFSDQFTSIVFGFAAKSIFDNDYDCVIAFGEGVPTLFASFLPNANKIAWVHCDYSSYMRLNKNPDEKKIYDKYKKIVCVSKYTKDEFCKSFEGVEEKTYAINNVVDVKNILSCAKLLNAEDCFKKSQFNIVSVGRISLIKRFSEIPKIVRTLVDDECDIQWYLIGSGLEKETRNELEVNIEKYRVEKYFHLLGEKDNPYPYISQADLLVNTSISEAAPNVIIEALILHVPVVCTNFGSAKEFVDNGINGFIVPLDRISETIEQLIKNKYEYERVRNGALKYTYNNDDIFKKVYSLLEE